MKELWNGVDEGNREKFLNEIYGSSVLYMKSYEWDQLPYGFQQRLTKFYDMFENMNK